MIITKGYNPRTNQPTGGSTPRASLRERRATMGKPSKVVTASSMRTAKNKLLAVRL